ncbi:DUF6082 family protein [Actinoallomurus spadix]|uniref:Uncharacterized protein n=1 Tax=Actinoallomurus spadix TaxID=79912 RepID=A0ABP3GAV2_9ACTN|nr:DUF6082 family protein [Actinoallomurus spadix]MCO5989743.1 DUF6082 family protein [Actinoallomurus spadix]
MDIRHRRPSTSRITACRDRLPRRGLALITLSPLALEFIADRRHVDWTRLGNVGQAYGAISAILSAFALVAVSISLALQAKESLANRRQVNRSIHMRLAELAMSDPVYMQCWGPGADRMPHDESRRAQFLNLMVSFWYMQWELRDISDEGLRSMAADNLFHTEAGRRFWLDQRERWTANSVGSRLNRFREVLDEALASALQTALGDQAKQRLNERTTRMETYRAAGVIAAASTATAACLLARRLMRGRRLR